MPSQYVAEIGFQKSSPIEGIVLNKNPDSLFLLMRRPYEIDFPEHLLDEARQKIVKSLTSAKGINFELEHINGCTQFTRICGSLQTLHQVFDDWRKQGLLSGVRSIDQVDAMLKELTVYTSWPYVALEGPDGNEIRMYSKPRIVPPSSNLG